MTKTASPEVIKQRIEHYRAEIQKLQLLLKIANIERRNSERQQSERNRELRQQSINQHENSDGQ